MHNIVETVRSHNRRLFFIGCDPTAMWFLFHTLATVWSASPRMPKFGIIRITWRGCEIQNPRCLPGRFWSKRFEMRSKSLNFLLAPKWYQSCQSTGHPHAQKHWPVPCIVHSECKRSSWERTLILNATRESKYQECIQDKGKVLLRNATETLTLIVCDIF